MLSVMLRRIAVLNQKGGVGKTTTAVNVAVALAQRSNRVLLIDLDGQRNATQFVGLGEVDGPCCDSLILDGVFSPQRDVLVPGLDVVPASRQQQALELKLTANIISGPKKLRKSVDEHAQGYDFVLTDCGPTLGLLAMNAVLACPEVLVPIELAHAAAMGAVTLRTWLHDVRMDAEPDLRVLGVLPTFADDRERTPRQMLAALKDIFGADLFETVIHNSAAIRDAAGAGRPVVLDAPQSRGAQEYQALTEEVIARGNHIA